MHCVIAEDNLDCSDDIGSPDDFLIETKLILNSTIPEG